MRKLWGDEAWEEYLNWQTQDKKTLKKINRLLIDIDRNGYQCIGKPEPLSGNLQGYWSVRIDEKNSILLKLTCNENNRNCYIAIYNIYYFLNEFLYSLDISKSSLTYLGVLLSIFFLISLNMSI